MSRAAFLQPIDHLFALILRHVAVQRSGRVAARFEAFGQFGGANLGAGEHQQRIKLFNFENSRQRIELVGAADQPVALPDGFGGAGGL